MFNLSHLKAVSYIVILSLLLVTAVPPSYAADTAVYGELIPAGNVMAMAGSETWQQVVQAMPVISGDTHLYKTEDGTISLVLNDGTRIEAAENTEFSVTGRTSENPIVLKRGVLTFSMSSGVDINITPVGVEIRASDEEPAGPVRTIGTASYVDSTVIVNSEQGEIAVTTPADGVGEMIILSGESYSYVVRDDGGEAVAMIPEGSEAAVVVPAKKVGGGGLTWVAVGLGLAAVAGLGLSLGGSGGDSGGGGSNPPASPSSP